MDTNRIGGIPSFHGLDDRALAAVAAVMHERAYPPGATILEQGRRMGGVFVLLEGRVRVARSLPDGATVDLVTLTPGAVFGVLAAMDGGPRAASCVAKDEVVCGVFSRFDFMELMEGRSRTSLLFQIGVLRDLHRDLRATNRRLVDLAALPEPDLSLVRVEDGFGSLT